MAQILSVFRRLTADQRGATAVEYALMTAVLTLSLLGIMFTGDNVEALYNEGFTLIGDVLSSGTGGGDAGGGG